MDMDIEARMGRHGDEVVLEVTIGDVHVSRHEIKCIVPHSLSAYAFADRINDLGSALRRAAAADAEKERFVKEYERRIQRMKDDLDESDAEAAAMREALKAIGTKVSGLRGLETRRWPASP